MFIIKVVFVFVEFNFCLVLQFMVHVKSLIFFYNILHFIYDILISSFSDMFFFLRVRFSISCVALIVIVDKEHLL